MIQILDLALRTEGFRGIDLKKPTIIEVYLEV
jgi:hypothetical protein